MVIHQVDSCFRQVAAETDAQECRPQGFGMGGKRPLSFTFSAEVVGVEKLLSYGGWFIG